ncbi:relaxase/mobilization nuclease domain-containing protein, partial [Staphylococcus hominis]|uniref:relaxase/mobilization nuclease domain-containing protein n=1 Tax=Staphylococcus hominis TaxID=1290 RepID=UPI001643C206
MTSNLPSHIPTTKLTPTKSTSPPINYPHKPPLQKTPLNSHLHYPKSTFKPSPHLYPKTHPNQPHLIIQSFKPHQLTPQQSNHLPLQLPQKLPPNHQLPLYTHNHTHHLHNHILINSIHLQTPNKFNNNKQPLPNLTNFNHH